MAGLMVQDATEIRPGQLLLRVIDPVLGERSLSRNLDPRTAQPGNLPNSCVDEALDIEGVLVRVVFKDGTDLTLERSAYVEAVGR